MSLSALPPRLGVWDGQGEQRCPRGHACPFLVAHGNEGPGNECTLLVRGLASRVAIKVVQTFS